MHRPKRFQVAVPFPTKGIDQSLPRSSQAALTCTEALNVCNFPPLSDRLGGGKRPGTRRAWNQQFTSDSGNDRILGLSSLITALGSVGSFAGDTLDRMYPTSTVSTDSYWTKVGAATIWECLDEPTPDLETTYVTGQPALNPASPNTIEFIVGYSAPMLPPATTDSVTVKLTYQVVVPTEFSEPGEVSGGGTDVICSIILNLDIMVGSSVIVTLDGFSLTQEPESDWATLSGVLTPAQIAAITAASPAWNTVRLRVRATTAGRFSCFSAVFNITQTEFILSGGGGGPPPNSGSATGQILVLSRGRCRVAQLPADMGSDTLPAEEVSDPADTSLTREVPSAAPFQGRWYCVDGDQTKIITPSATTSGPGSAPTVSAWNATNGGAVPQNCRLVCVYSGRLVLARQEGAEPSASIWYMSRRLDPLDWAFAADDQNNPAETAAVAGTNEYLGQPADAITALIPYGDDYLIFGCARSLWMMEGDPGFGGRVVNLSQQTGVLDSRAWCFDEAGRLYFLGSSGLYRFSKAGGLENISGRRLYRVLDRINAGETFIQLVYSAFRKEVMIFLTPKRAPSTANAPQYGYTVFTDGQAVHLRYDVGLDAFFYDDCPWDTMGPWAVLEIYGAPSDDRTYLIGGADGYIRRPFEGGYIAGSKRNGTADDMPRTGSSAPGVNGACYAITSSFRSAPMEAPMGAREMRAVEIQASGTDNNYPLALPMGPVQWKLVAGDGPTEVTGMAGTAAVASGTWFQDQVGWQEPVGLSHSAGCFQLIVAQNNNRTQSWALDRITLWFMPSGRRR